MRVQLVDPSAFTPPYDRALAAALARAGAEVNLVTTKFLYGEVPEAEGFTVDERFYQRSAARGLSSSARLPFKGAEHLRDMLAFRRAASDADVVHYQWLTLPGLDPRLLPPTRRQWAGRPLRAAGLRRDGRRRRPLRAWRRPPAGGGRPARRAGAGDPP